MEGKGRNQFNLSSSLIKQPVQSFETFSNLSPPCEGGVRGGYKNLNGPEKNMKKGLLIVGAVAIAIATVPMFAAFEAHVINVTAKIENALAVNTEAIEFGTVFPQEYLKFEDLYVSLSRSFLGQDRLDDVKYVIKQKPKPRSVAPEWYTQGLYSVNPNMYMPGGALEDQLNPDWIEDDALRTEYCHIKSPSDPADPNDLYYINCYPNLCSYLSKHKHESDHEQPTDVCENPDPTSQNPYYDCGVDAFHDPSDPANYAYGYLIQSVNDDSDRWVIDLDVPCFEGQCAQDWTHQGWELPGGLESEVFGCDLWIEVYGFSPWTAPTASGE